MRWIAFQLASGLAAALALASPATAGGSLKHLGMNDPAAEGFGKYVVGTDPGPGPGNDGLDYWEVDKSDPATSFYYYFVGQFDPALSTILAAPGGWVLSVTARVVASTGGAPAVTVSDPLTGGMAGGDTWSFALVPNAGNPNQSQLTYLSYTNQLAPITSLNVGEYHDYEFTLDPGATPFGSDDAVEVRVDGALVGTVERSFIKDDNSAQTLRFGDATPGAGSRSRWARVEFTAVPEPARPLLLLVAAAALGSGAASRSRAAARRGA
jgi:hypothetical protein